MLKFKHVWYHSCLPFPYFLGQVIHFVHIWFGGLDENKYKAFANLFISCKQIDKPYKKHDQNKYFQNFHWNVEFYIS
jgi:hypothetical protein